MNPEDNISFSDLTVSPLNNQDDTRPFQCRKEMYTRFLKKDACDAMDECTGCTHLVHYKDSSLVGYFTLINDIIVGEQIEQFDMKPGYRYESYPALKIARLATHKDWEGRGIGQFMLVQSVSFAIKVNSISACRFITVDAIHEKVGFYKKFGFVVIEESIGEKTTSMYFNHTAISRMIREQQNKIS